MLANAQKFTLHITLKLSSYKDEKKAFIQRYLTYK